MSHLYEIYRDPARDATMTPHGLHIMPLWTYTVGAITAAVTVVVGAITPQEATQWIGVVVNACIALIWIYGFWARTVAQKTPSTVPASDDEIPTLPKRKVK